MGKLTLAAVLAFAALAVAVALNSRNRMSQAETDAHVVADTNRLVEQYLASLESDDPVILRYGSFKSWDRGDWSRANYAFRLVSRLDVQAVAHFERADADVAIAITTGPRRVTLTMTPSDAWISEQPERHFEVVSREMFASTPDGRTRCSLQAAATHPDFVAD
jgi:hypothetical protein